MTIRLPQAQVLLIDGPDAIAFAQAQFASDLRELGAGTWQWSAWLSPQGRVRALFRLLRIGDDTLHAVLSGGSAEDLRRQLLPFVFRARVTLEVAAAVNAIGSFDEADVRERLGAVPTAAAIVRAQGRTGLLAGGREPRWLVYGETGDATPAPPAALDRWRLADIDAGIVELGPALQDRFLAPALGLDRLGAISVRKGCYPGQEIVARLHFKGGNKRWLHRLDFVAAELPGPATPLVSAGTAAGELLQSAWTVRPRAAALAVLTEATPAAALTTPSTGVADFRVVSAVRVASD